MKRSAVWITATVVGALALGGCSAGSDSEAPAESGPVTLTWWTWWAGAPGIADAWNAEHPDIQVKVTNVGGGTDQFTKLNAAVRAGEGPDLALAEYQWLPSYISSGVAADISEYVDGIEDQYSPAVWNLVHLGDDGVYGVPLDQAPMLLMYRADLFEQYGLSVPTTWDAFADTARQSKQAAPDSVLANFPTSDAGWLAGLTAQAGGDWWSLDDDTWSVDIDGAAPTKVAEYWDGLVGEGVVSAGASGTPEFNAQLNSGKILTQVIGSWGATGSSVKTGAPDTIGKWRIAPLPSWTDDDPGVGFQGGSSSLVTTTSKHPKQAAKFLTWLGSTAEGQGVMIEQGGNFPASAPGLDVYASIPQPADKAAAGQEDFHDILLDVAADTTDVTWGPNTTVAFSAYTDQVGKALGAGRSFADALRAVQKTVRADLEKSGFDVE
ncbi:extracellular solute-binding protein [Plantibacter sp. ME-Dv--P-122b]|uniref:ABC transporter substrate-binding protein n=1 Tax=Plantibacter sp. ME-Dv--P-122b TaxID=3040300 RepID=UPI00254D4C14|nr:extracellular solute-binding protein [Plantibacter sp. ME-Dv--P-122b]